MSVWMGATLFAAVLVSGAARAVESLLAGGGWPRRWSWAAAMGATLALAVLPRWLPFPPLLPGGPGALALSGSVKSAGSTPGGGGSGVPAALDALDPVLLVSWIGATTVLALLHLWTRSRMRREIARSKRAVIGGVEVVLTRDVGPGVWGLLRPRIVLPAALVRGGATEAELVLRHEREHLRAGDSRLTAAGALAVTLLPWCLPLWWQYRRLRGAIEADCDARVIAGGVDVRRYGRVLLDLAGRPRAFPLQSPALRGSTSSSLERRILAMTEKGSNRPFARAIPLAFTAALLLLGACELASRGSPVTGPAAEGDAAVSAPAAAPTAGVGAALYVVDDVVLARAPTQAELERLDIDRIEVIKGAAAKETYGERGANGVVLIWTRERS